MGWTYTYKEPGMSIKDFFKREMGVGVKDVAVVGNDAYIAYKDHDVIYAIVALLDKTGKQGGNDPRFNFGYKEMGESEMPYSFACPKRILDVLSPVDYIYEDPDMMKNAIEWRAKNGYKQRAVKRKVVQKRTIKTTTKCPRCKSLDTEQSWAHGGYIQCNKCGVEWITPKFDKKPRKSNTRKK